MPCYLQKQVKKLTCCYAHTHFVMYQFLPAVCKRVAGIFCMTCTWIRHHTTLQPVGQRYASFGQANSGNRNCCWLYGLLCESYTLSQGNIPFTPTYICIAVGRPGWGGVQSVGAAYGCRAQGAWKIDGKINILIYKIWFWARNSFQLLSQIKGTSKNYTVFLSSRCLLWAAITIARPEGEAIPQRHCYHSHTRKLNFVLRSAM
jgi:hypothetical protein